MYLVCAGETVKYSYAFPIYVSVVSERPSAVITHAAACLKLSVEYLGPFREKHPLLFFFFFFLSEFFVPIMEIKRDIGTRKNNESALITMETFFSFCNGFPLDGEKDHDLISLLSYYLYFHFLSSHEATYIATRCQFDSFISYLLFCHS